MKVYADRLSASLRGGRVPQGVIFFGPEEPVMEESLEEILQHLRQESPSLQVVTHSASDWLSSPSLMRDYGQPGLFQKGKTVVVVEDVTDRLTPLMEEVEKEPLTDVTLFLKGSHLKTTSKLVKLGVASSGLWAVGCYEISKESFQKKIQEKISLLGLKIDPAGRDYLIHQDLGSYGEIKGVLDKLSLYGASQETITLEEVKACWGRSGEAFVETLVEGVLSRQKEKWMASFSALESEHMILFLRTLNGTLLKILEVQGYMRQGMEVESAIQALRPVVFFKQVPLFKAYVRGWTTGQLVKMIERVASLEKSFKSSLPVVALKNEFISFLSV